MPGEHEISNLLLHVCHDLRNPLRAIRAHTELLLKHPVSPAVSDSEGLGFIVDGARKIELLVDGLARYAIALQIDDESFQSTAMDVLLRGALAKLHRELGDTGAEVTYDTIPRIRGNPDRLMELWESLIRNALVHRGAENPRIHIAARKQAETWVFAVYDNGPGVEADYLETIFRPFERLNGNPRAGVGLGLAICRAIVERHGGKIWAESADGNGSTFFFALPGE